jgi:ribose transport system substrate-binding protein
VPRCSGNRLNGAGKVAIITGIMGHTTHMDRLKGAKAVFEAEEGMEIVAVQPANSDRYQGMQVMENILTANPDLNGVFCLNDQMALGALEAIKAAEKLEEITIIGFDGTPEACQSIKKGEMDATVGERPSEFGSSAVKYAVKILNHENIPKNIELTLKMVTEENADEWIKCW